MPRLATLIALLCLALPGAAFAQGAGDDQYQDPFGDEPVSSQTPPDDGLSDTPPGGGSDGGSDPSGGGTTGSGDSGAGSDGGATSPGSTGTAPDAGTAAEADEQAPGQLPNTGADPRVLMLLGTAFLLVGVGLRLRTIDPDAF